MIHPKPLSTYPSNKVKVPRSKIKTIPITPSLPCSFSCQHPDTHATHSIHIVEGRRRRRLDCRRRLRLLLLLMLRRLNLRDLGLHARELLLQLVLRLQRLHLPAQRRHARLGLATRGQRRGSGSKSGRGACSGRVQGYLLRRTLRWRRLREEEGGVAVRVESKNDNQRE